MAEEAVVREPLALRARPRADGRLSPANRAAIIAATKEGLT
jgi:hypothetical protein